MSRNQPTTLLAYSCRGISSGSPRSKIRNGCEGSSPCAIAFISRRETIRLAPSNCGTRDGDGEAVVMMLWAPALATVVDAPRAIPVATGGDDGVRV